MKSKYVVFIAFFIFIIQSTALQFFRIYGVIPNLLLVFLVGITLIYGKKEGYIFAITSGILVDIFLSKALSINLMIYVSIVFFITLFYEKLFKDNFLTPIIVIFLSTILYHIMFLMFMYLLGFEFNKSLINNISIFESIENIFVIVLVYGKVFPKVYGYDMK